MKLRNKITLGFILGVILFMKGKSTLSGSNIMLHFHLAMKLYDFINLNN